MSSPEEIWSTRLQRELLALTTTDEESKKHIGTLPPFITVQSHTLDIAEGRCTVAFAIEVDHDHDHADANVAAKEKKEIKINEPNRDSCEESKEQNNEETTTGMNENDDDHDNKNIDDSKEEESEEGKNETTNESTKTDTVSSPSETETKSISTQVIITIDASLHRRLGVNTPDASLSYPFFKPKAYLTSGTQFLPISADIINGCMIQIDCDWTPSLHLNDAALNIALKVRESVKRGESCLRVEHDDYDNNDGETFDSKVSSFFSSLKTRASAIVEEVDHKIDVAMREHPKSPNRRKEQQQQQQQQKQQVVEKVVTEDNVEIGDVINLSQGPWNSAVGSLPTLPLRWAAAWSAPGPSTTTRKVKF